MSLLSFEENKVSVRSLVALFEHVHASGSPNFQLCRIPLPTSLKLEVWHKKLQCYPDKMVCQYLEFGFPMDFDRSKELKFDAGRNHKGARDFPDFIVSYLRRECSQLRIVGPFQSNPLSVPLVISPLNSVPKSDTVDRRVIVDLSWPHGTSVNDGISKDSYMNEPINLRYASIEEVCDMILEVGRGAVIYKRDLKQAYRQIPVDPADYQYLGYMWEGEVYFDTVLAMGQRNAAMACTRTTQAVIYLHEQDGYRGTNYLDDLIGVARIEDGDAAYESLGVLLEELGLLENLKKASPPAVVQIVLGVQIDTVNLTLSVTEDRLEELMELFGKWENKKKATKTELQSLLGKLCFVTKCVRQSRVFLNRMLETLRSISSRNNSVHLTAAFKKDLAWWKKFVNAFNGVSFIPSPIWSEPDFFFSTDSCLFGCGGICNDEYFHSSYPGFIIEQNLPIHQLELLAVLVAIRTWGRKYSGAKIQLYCDNEAAVRVINSSKTKDSFMGSCLRELWLEVCCFQFELRAIHLPGEENRLADWLSRWDLNEKYGSMFCEFLNGETTCYKEILITPELFMFSGDL